MIIIPFSPALIDVGNQELACMMVIELGIFYDVLKWDQLYW